MKLTPLNDRFARIADWEQLAQSARFQPAKMAACCPVSLRHLERFFARTFHQRPGEWVRHLRCRLARELISAGWPNKAVVYELGFGNESHLCHEFKRIYGTSPQSFGPANGNQRLVSMQQDGVGFRQ